MTAIVQIDDEVIDAGEFMRLLKLNGQFDSLIEQLVRDKLTVRAAKKHGVVVTAEDIPDAGRPVPPRSQPASGGRHEQATSMRSM